MGSLVKAVLLSVLLDPAFLLTQQDEGKCVRRLAISRPSPWMAWCLRTCPET